MAADKVGLWNIALTMIGSPRLSTITDEVEEQRAISAVYDDVRDEVLKEFDWGFARKRVALIDIKVPSATAWATATAYAVGDEVEYEEVHYTCLVANTSTDFAADLAAVSWETTTDWVTATQYILGDQVYNAGVSYACIDAHTSSALFATDLASVYWLLSERLELTEDRINYIYRLPSDFLKLTLVSDSKAIVKLEGSRLLSDTTDLKIGYTYQNDTPSTYTSEFTIALANKLAYEISFNLINSTTKTKALLERYENVTLPKATAIDSQQGTPKQPIADDWELSRLSGSGSFKTTGEVWHPV